MNQYSIELTGLRFFAFHGLYEEEIKKGGEFLVDLKAVLHTSTDKIEHINDSADYAVVFEIISRVMAEPEKLLETVAGKMAEKIHERFQKISELDITIAKLKPPIKDFEGRVAVRLVKKY